MLHSSIYSGQVERVRIFLLGAMPVKFALMNSTGSRKFRAFGAVAALLAAVLSCFASVFAQEGTGEPVAFVKCSEIASEGVAVGPYVTAGGRVIASEANGVLRALDDVRFETIWKSELGGEIASNVAVYGEFAYLVNNSRSGQDESLGTSVLRSINVNTGLTSRTLSIPFSTRFTIYASADGVIALGSSGTAAMYDTELNQAKWESLSPVAFAPASDLSINFIVIAKEGGNALFLDARTGATVTDLKTEANLTAAAFANGDTAFLGDDRGNVSKVNLSGGQVAWTFKTGGGVSFLHVVDGSLYVASNDNFFYRISANSGGVVWRKRMPGRMIIPPLVVAENAFLPVVGENSVAVIETGKGKVIGRLSLGDEQFPASAIFAAADGAVVVPVAAGLVIFNSSACAANR